MIQALKALFQKPIAGARPDVVAMLGGSDVSGDPGVLVVDGALAPEADWVHARFAAATVVRQTADGVERTGLPFDEGDSVRLPDRAGGWSLIVLVDVIDRILDPAYALAALRESLAPGGSVLLLQAVSPDDPAARADWNVLGRMRDGRHTWTPTRRQVRAIPSGAGFDRGDEELWAETVDISGSRDDTREALRLFADDVEGRGLVSGGRLAVTRLALVLTVS